MPGVLIIPINLNEIQYEINNLKMIVHNKIQCFKDINEWKSTVGFRKSQINVLIYDKRIIYSLSKQDSSNLLINLECLDFSYEFDNLFQETNIFPYFKTFKKDVLKVNQDLCYERNEIQKSDDSVNSNQEWNNTNDIFNGFGGMEYNRINDAIKLEYNINYEFNITKMLQTNEINCYMSKNEIYNKVKRKIIIIPFGSFPPTNDIIKILPFQIKSIKTQIINIQDNKNVHQNYQQYLDNIDMLRFNDEIYFSDNIIRCFHLWMKFQSSKIEFLNS